MAKTSYLVTGATGATGGATARQLLAKGYQVRALAHRRDERSDRLRELGAEVVFGDLLDFEMVRDAFKSVRRAYFCYPIRPGIARATAQFAQAAREVNAEFIVNISQKSARGDAKSDAAQQHWLSERVFDWSGIPTVHIRPTYFAEWLLYLAPAIRQGRMPAPFGVTGRHAPIAAEDQASVIVGLLEKPEGHAGAIYPLYGKVELTHPEIAATVGRTLNREVRYSQVSVEEFAEVFGQRPNRTAPPILGATGEAAVVAHNTSYLLAHLREVAIDHHNGIFAGANDTVQKIGGREPMTIEQFVQQNRAAFE
jgi:NAD(P)H dehydrogenase (quinone)